MFCNGKFLTSFLNNQYKYENQENQYKVASDVHYCCFCSIKNVVVVKTEG